MKPGVVILVFFILVVGLAGLAWGKVRTCCAQDAAGEETIGVQNLSSQDFKQWLETKRQEVFLLDARTPEEYQKGRIDQPDALIDYRAIQQAKDKLPADKKTPILVYCRSGNRSAQAAQTLIDLGYTQVYNLEKGIVDWQNQGFSIRN